MSRPQQLQTTIPPAAMSFHPLLNRQRAEQENARSSALNVNTNHSIECPDGPTDGISAVTWHSDKNLLACSSWDKTLRLYDVNVDRYEVPQESVDTHTVKVFQAPVLCCGFSKTHVISGGCDNLVHANELGSGGSESFVGKGHTAPVKEVFWVQGLSYILSGSWDKTLKFWDMRDPNGCVATIDLPEKVYSMDLRDDTLVLGLAERRLQVYNLSMLQRMGNKVGPVKDGETALKLQTRCVSCFPDKKGYAVGSIEGRCSIAYLDTPSSNFAFKCHRSTDEIFAVNAICFHPVHGTFCTAGADGNFVFWDKDNRQRLKAFNSCNAPITSAKFNAKGDLFAYGVSYDQQGRDPNLMMPPQDQVRRKVLLHRVDENEVKPKAQTNRGGVTSEAARQRRT